MKATDLIEAIQAADKEFQRRFKTPMEIFDLEFESDEDALLIEASAKVTYEYDHDRGNRRGKPPNCDVLIRFEIRDGDIVDRSIEIENIRLPKGRGR